MLNLRFTPKFMLGMVAAAAMTTSVALSGCTNKESKADTKSTEEETEYVIKVNNVIMGKIANALDMKDSVDMKETMKNQKIHNLKELERKYNLAIQKRKKAEIILEGTKRVAPDEANQAEKK